MHFVPGGRVMVVGLAYEPAIMAEVRGAVLTAAECLGVPAPPVRMGHAHGGPFAFNGAVYIGPAWLDGVLRRYCFRHPVCRWAVILGIVAHEICHLIYGDPKSTPAVEGRADFHTGLVLALAGLPRQFSQMVIAELSRGCNETHGCDFQRVAMIERGYWYGLSRAA